MSARWSSLRDVRALLFDLGGTVLSIDHARIASYLAEDGIRVSEGWAARSERAGRVRLDRLVREGADGRAQWRGFFEAFLLEAGAPAARMDSLFERVAEFHRRQHLWNRPVPGVREALTALGHAGFRLAVVSNSDGRAEWLLGTVGLAREFEFVVDSAEVGFDKPDARIFRLACERFGLAPERCAYLGDVMTIDVEGSARAGLRPILVDHYGSYEAGHVPAGVPRVVEASEIVAGMRAASKPSGEIDPVDGREGSR
jgi:putative hydrolase of the HAD superfamily